MVINIVKMPINERLKPFLNPDQGGVTLTFRKIIHKIQNTLNKFLIMDKNNIQKVLSDKSLKKSLKGKNNYLFLINDTSSEIRQHFDDNYQNNFNSEDFIRYFNEKKEFCKTRNIEYYFFMVPDKSWVCKDLLPFNVANSKRNYSKIEHIIPDFSGNLDHKSYFMTDSHINYLGGRELSYCFLNSLNEDFKREDLTKLINDQIIVEYTSIEGDLTSNSNWSYSDIEKTDYLQEEVMIFKSKGLKYLNISLPEKFRKCHGRRDTEYWKNKNSHSNQRVLILRDSSMNLLKNVFATYFNETLLYWDQWDFNQELVEWYKPDIVIDIRTERFLENMNKFI